MAILIHGIVLGYGKFEETSCLCLNSLISDIKGSHTVVTVIDNGSPDNSAVLQAQFVKNHPQFNSVTLAENLGYAGGMNYGAALIDATWILLIGSDTVFSSGALQLFCDILPTLDPKVGIVGPVTNEAGTAQQMSFLSAAWPSIIQEFQEQYKEPSGLHVPLCRADFFCVAIRKTLWDELGGLDLAYGRGYYEDFDFCLRAKARGYQIIMLEDVFIYHAGSQSFKSDSGQKQLIKKNKDIFIQKFPQAELRHRRLDQLKTLQYYLSLPNSFIRQSQIKKRIMHRLEMVKNDQPRSFWKKWRWGLQVKAIEHEIQKRLSE